MLISCYNHITFSNKLGDTIKWIYTINCIGKIRVVNWYLSLCNCQNNIFNDYKCRYVDNHTPDYNWKDK